ncbi:MAG: HD domain-containing protein [Acidobacteriota bacterium]
MDPEREPGRDALERKFAFFREVEKLKTIKRANETLDGRKENSAEHSWHAALMAMLLEECAGGAVDMLKVIKMLIIHDLVEIDAGDTFIYSEDSDADRCDAELQAAKRLFSLLPDHQASEYFDLWEEFELRTTHEAKFAAAIDGIQPLLNRVAIGNKDDLVVPVKKVWEKKEYIRRFTPRLWMLVEELIEESVERGFYQ